MKKFWAPNLNNIQAFGYYFSIPIDNENFEELILEVDCFFLIIAEKYKIVYFNDRSLSEYIATYTNDRKRNFVNSNDNKRIGLLTLNTYYDPFKEEFDGMCFGIPEYVGNEIKIIDTPFVSRHNIFDLLSNYYPGYDDKTKTYKGVNELSFDILSYSNIWWEEIDYEISCTGYRAGLELDPPHNNRDIAYRITPRFNSFIRALSEKILSLGGIFDVYNESHRDSVTKEGILLDGKIIYQEDIDNGLIELPPPCKEDE
jgi:hypothetical protein